MSPTPEADPAAPGDPADDRPRALLGIAFWATLVFGLLCVAAGVAVALLGPKLWAEPPATPHVLAPPPVRPRAPASQPVASRLGDRAQSR